MTLRESGLVEADALGATGEMTDRGIAHDEGAFQMRTAVDTKKGLVVVDFGKKVAWFMMDAERAEEFAERLLGYVKTLRDAGHG